jgi:hypothetical protein
MPLTVNNGTLNPQPLDPAEEQHLLNVPHRPQEGRLWCWAACVQMVLEHNHKQMDQCAIVGKMLNQDNHLCGQTFQSRNESCAPLNMGPTWDRCGMKVNPHTGTLDINQIKAEIAANRPIQVGIIWHVGSGHAVLIKGWARTTPETLLIDDPLRDSPQAPVFDVSGRATLTELINAFGHGFWRFTWSELELKNGGNSN